MRREGTAPNPSPKGLTPVFAARPAAAGRAGLFLHRVIPVSSDMGYTRKKGNSLHRGYNPAMKNKRSEYRRCVGCIVRAVRKRRMRLSSVTRTLVLISDYSKDFATIYESNLSSCYSLLNHPGSHHGSSFIAFITPGITIYMYLTAVCSQLYNS